jgi:hypothetical protein
MVEYLERIGVEIDEVAGHMDRDQLPLPLPVVQIPAHEAFHQQIAMRQGGSSMHDGCACIERAYFGYGAFQRGAFFTVQMYAGAAAQETFCKHKRGPYSSNGSISGSAVI